MRLFSAAEYPFCFCCFTCLTLFLPTQGAVGTHVIDKQCKNKTRRIRDGDLEHYIQCTVRFRTDSGKKEISVGSSNGDPEFRVYYDYLNIGDRVRYHPQLAFKYEKYDKSHDREIPCMFCKTMNDIQNDRCEVCHCLLLK